MKFSWVSMKFKIVIEPQNLVREIALETFKLCQRGYSYVLSFKLCYLIQEPLERKYKLKSN